MSCYVTYLEEDGVVRVSPEVRDGVATVTATGKHFKAAVALAIGTWFSLLLLARFVADGGSQGDAASRVQGASRGADQDSETGLLEDVDIVVVGVPHGPPACVPTCLLALC